MRRGDYALSVETPGGTRNVVAPAEGVVEVHVSLMQDLLPNSLLFSIAHTTSQTESADENYARNDGRGSKEQPAANPDALRSTSNIPQLEKRLTIVRLFFLLMCIALASIWPGSVFAFLGGALAVNLQTAVIVGVLGLALLIPVWLLAKVRFLAGRKRSALATLGTSLVFAGALAVGNKSGA